MNSPKLRGLDTLNALAVYGTRAALEHVPAQEWIAPEQRQPLLSREDELRLATEQLDRIAQILADFYRAPLSISSVQPILDLAVELNPSLLRESK